MLRSESAMVYVVSGFSRRLAVLAAGLVCSAAAVLAQQTPQATARAAATEFAEGRFSELYARFNTRMRTAVTEPALRQLVAPQITGSAGAFERVDGETTCQAVSGVQSCVTPLLFENARLSLRIAVDAGNQVVGLFVAGMEPRGTPGGLSVAAGALRLPAVLTLAG